MKNKLIAFIKNWWLLLLALTLYLTGYHTPVLSGVQRALLYTGLFSPEYTTKPTNYPAADYSLQLYDSTGQLVPLESFRGQPIFLNFWASWCAPCLAEMPGIATAAYQTRSEVAFVLVTVEDNRQKAEALLKKKGWNLPLYTLAAARPTQYQSGQVPATYVIDTQGRLVLQHTGMAQYGDASFIAWLKTL